MEGEEPLSASPNPSSPPQEPETSPVGSPDEAVVGVHPPLSDDEHDLDRAHEDDQSVATGGLTEDLKQRIIKQFTSELLLASEANGKVSTEKTTLERS